MENPAKETTPRLECVFQVVQNFAPIRSASVHWYLHLSWRQIRYWKSTLRDALYEPEYVTYQAAQCPVRIYVRLGRPGHRCLLAGVFP